jgi:hypothetical protein
MLTNCLPQRPGRLPVPRYTEITGLAVNKIKMLMFFAGRL